MESPKAEISQISWLEGHWKGEALGGFAEESWLPIAGGSMVGTFRLIVNDEVSFYEIMTITEEEGTLILRLKHFNADLKGWEEKEETEDFKLVKIEKNAAYFDELTMKRSGKDGLDVYVRMHQKDGNFSELHFPYLRVY
jgi:hypothetical protein